MSRCESRKCGAEIIFARTLKGNDMPLDATPRQDGNALVIGRPSGKLIVKVTNAPYRPGQVRYMPHWVTCTDAGRWKNR